MAYLYLIRHPRTQPDPALPASAWSLDPAGEAEVRALTNLSLWDGISAVYTSHHPKAARVGEAVHAVHAIPHVVVPGLEEARRERFLDSVEAFEAMQRAFFAHPDRPPLPDFESAASALARFNGALENILAQHPAPDSLAVVSHATVLTLYVAHLAGRAPDFAQWRSIGFAAIMAIDRATIRPCTGFLTAPYDELPHP
ncbi:MAG: histidine phosphatase family protein [Chloroflexi bacterium]|nr:histidine phosphatase family protein [Chloroflexota bacterium]